MLLVGPLSIIVETKEKPKSNKSNKTKQIFVKKVKQGSLIFYFIFFSSLFPSGTKIKHTSTRFCIIFQFSCCTVFSTAKRTVASHSAKALALKSSSSSSQPKWRTFFPAEWPESPSNCCIERGGGEKCRSEGRKEGNFRRILLSRDSLDLFFSKVSS